jgi:hypothetical protein
VKEEVSAEKCTWWREMYTSGGHNTTTPMDPCACPAWTATSSAAPWCSAR